MTDLLPVAPLPIRQMKQPRKDDLRDQLAAALADNARLAQEIAHLRMPWWRRLSLRVRGTRKESS